MQRLSSSSSSSAVYTERARPCDIGTQRYSCIAYIICNTRIRICECERRHHGSINPHRKLIDSFRPDLSVAAADVVNTRFYIKYCQTAFNKSARSYRTGDFFMGMRTCVLHACGIYRGIYTSIRYTHNVHMHKA